MELKYINPYYKNRVSLFRTYGKDIYEEFIPPVYDRTYEDIATLLYYLNKGFKNLTEEEKEVWLTQDFKGALNASDLNRIENNMRVLALVTEVEIQTKTWDTANIPTLDEFTRLKNNLTLIRTKIPLKDDTPEIPELPWNTYQKINDVEKILNDMYDILNTNFYYYCGHNSSNSVIDIYCGEGMGLI